MVSNELSIRASQIEKVALKVADNNVEKYKLLSAKEISKIRSMYHFASDKQEKTLFDSRMNYLAENINALNSKSALEAKTVYLNNNRLIEKLEWSYVNIDRTNPDFEMIKKQIATHRHQSVITDNKYEEAAIQAKWYSYEKERDIEYKLNYSDLCQELYGSNPHLEDVTYRQFYENTCNEYQKLQNDFKADFDLFLVKIKKVINDAYVITYAKDIRENIISTANFIIELKKQELEIRKELCYQDVDLQILNQQAKENLDVYEERNTLENAILENKQKISTIKDNADKLFVKYIDYLDNYQQVFTKPIDVSIDESDKTKKELLENIKEAFRLPAEKVFAKIYSLISTYYISKIPFFYDYLENKETEYNKKVIEFRNNQVKQLPEQLKKVYQSEKDYLQYLFKDESSQSKFEALEKSHLENLENIQKAKIQGQEKIVNDRLNRKKEYLEQKQAAKVALKIADGSKASEIKEVLKVYKNDINAGDNKRKAKLSKQISEAIANEQKRYEREKVLLTCPKALSYRYEYENKVASDAKEKAKEISKKKKVLAKDLSLSKYRRNMNASARENRLGYIFLSIWAIGFIVFALFPIIYTILMCVSKIGYDNAGYSVVFKFSYQKGFELPNYSGKSNFYALFLSDVTFAYNYVPRFARSLLFYVPIVVFIGFVLALLLNSKIKGRTFFRIIYFLPVVIVSGPVLSMLNDGNTSGSSSIRLTLDGSSVAKILESLSPKALQYANEVFQNFIIILWMTGVPIVLFISALQKINRQLYEAADIDGANGWQKLWAITFPLIKSVLLIICLFTIMQVTTIDVSFVNPINGWLNNTLSSSKVNYGVVALGSWVQTIIVLVFVLVAFLLFREKEFVSKDKNYEEMEEAKRKKAQRKARRAEIFHVRDIQNFFTKLFSPITRIIEERKQKKEEKELGGKY